jgi:predicted MPP superfamily phosphohydrolase
MNLLHRNTKTHTPLLSRRRFLQALVGSTLALGAAGAYVRAVEPAWFAVEPVTIVSRTLPPALDGRRLAHISDIHLSEYMSPTRFAAALRRVRDLSPDWLVMTGDYVGRNPQDAAGLVETLRLLDTPIFASLGNHDHWTDHPTVQRYLEEGGATVLVNQSVQLDGGLWLAGLDDIWSGRPDLRAALRNVPSTATTIVLAHEPDFFDIILQTQAPVRLQLSGHSHGGQVRLPLLRPEVNGSATWAPILPPLGRRYPIGLRTVGECSIYTNRGLGVWPMPYRLNCRPEITLFTFRRT